MLWDLCVVSVLVLKKKKRENVKVYVVLKPKQLDHVFLLSLFSPNTNGLISTFDSARTDSFILSTASP